MTPPVSSLNGIVTRIKILSKLNIAEHRLPQDGRMKIKTTEREIDVRVSILPWKYLVANSMIDLKQKIMKISIKR